VSWCGEEAHGLRSNAPPASRRTPLGFKVLSVLASPEDWACGCWCRSQRNDDRLFAGARSDDSTRGSSPSALRSVAPPKPWFSRRAGPRPSSARAMLASSLEHLWPSTASRHTLHLSPSVLSRGGGTTRSKRVEFDRRPPKKGPLSYEIVLTRRSWGRTMIVPVRPCRGQPSLAPDTQCHRTEKISYRTVRETPGSKCAG